MFWVKEPKFRLIALFIGIILLAEVMSSVFLFRYYSYKKSTLAPEGTATGFLIKKALGIYPAETFVADKSEMFRPDALLGYTTNPGIYNITATRGDKKHGYRVTVTDSGVRATSYHSTAALRRIYVLGDSVIWAVGLDDEMTAPWLLQTRLPDYQVINLALTGYSNVQQLLQYRKLKDTLHPDDIVIFSYSSTDLLRNVADPRLTAGFKNAFEMSLSNKEILRNVRVPYAILAKNSALDLKYARLVCASGDEQQCARDTPKLEVLGAIATKIFSEIIQDRKCHILVAFFLGDDSDPVISFLRSHGAPIADLRIRPGTAYDDYVPEEQQSHPGPFANFWFYEALLAALSKNQMLVSHN